MNPRIPLYAICLAVPALAIAQAGYGAAASGGARSADDQRARSVESERQRLGNERIRLEMERRAREEEQRRLEAAEQERLREEQAALAAAEEERLRQEQAALEVRQGGAQASKPDTSAAPSRPDMSKMLEQLRTLGELKDAGYITEPEFQRIKRRILDDQT